MNAVTEMVHLEGLNQDEVSTLMLKVNQYLPVTRQPRSNYDPTAVKRIAAHELVRDNDKYFNQYVYKISAMGTV
jgi:hypothetical protein